MSTADSELPFYQLRRIDLQFQSVEEVLSEMQLIATHIEQQQLLLKQVTLKYKKILKEIGQEATEHQSDEIQKLKKEAITIRTQIIFLERMYLELLPDEMKQTKWKMTRLQNLASNKWGLTLHLPKEKQKILRLFWKNYEGKLTEPPVLRPDSSKKYANYYERLVLIKDKLRELLMNDFPQEQSRSTSCFAPLIRTMQYCRELKTAPKRVCFWSVGFNRGEILVDFDSAKILMEKNTKDKKKLKSKLKNDDTTEDRPFGQSIFDYYELVLVVFSHLPITELSNVKIVCKKWNILADDPTIWKGVILNTFGIFIGPEYRKIINSTNGVDLRRAVKDPLFARTLFHMDKDNPQSNQDPADIFGIRQLSNKALIGQLFSDKPIWRSPWLTNHKSKTNDKIFTLPQFQRHNYPQSDSLFTQIFMGIIIERMMDPKEFWNELMNRTKSSDRSKAIVIICQWIANYNWKKFSKVLDPLLSQFLETASNEEKQQIERAQHLAALNKEYDWEKHDQTYFAKMNNEQKKAFRTTIKPKLLQQPIDIMDIPPREMAKQVALIEQKHFRKLTFDFFMLLGWNNTSPHAVRFNKITAGLTYWILSQPTSNKRCEAIAYLIKLGYELIQLRCVIGIFFIIACLHGGPIFRLLSYKKAIKKYEKEYSEIERIVSTAMGYKVLRNFQKDSTGHASVPYIGITLVDLMFIEESNASHNIDQVNMRKAVMFMSSICKIMDLQLVPYLFEPVEPLQELWDHFQEVTEKSLDELFALSLAIMPRGAEKERESFNDDNAKQ